MSKPDLTLEQQQMFWQRKSEIEIIGGFDTSKLVGREIQGYNLRKGWVHVCYFADLPDYLAKQHYNTPGHLRSQPEQGIEP